jgi:hypothetical protein
MSRYSILFILSTLIFSCDTASNIKPPYNNYFFKYFGNVGNQKAVDLVVNNSDGTFYILGNSKAPDSVQKIYLAHADAHGQLIHENTYGSPDKKELDAKDFLITSDGKLAVVANVNGSNSEVLLIRFSLSSLTPVSQNDIVALKLEFAPSANVYANSLTELNDGGFIVMGYTDFVNGITNELFDAVHFRTSNDLTQFTSTYNDGNAWYDIDGNKGINSFQATNKGISAFQHPTINSEFIFFGTMNATNQNKYTFWSFSRSSGSYPSDTASLNLQSNEILTSALKTTDAGYLMSGLSVSSNGTIKLKLARCFSDILKFDASDFNLTNTAFSLGNYPLASSNLGLVENLFAVANNSSSGNGAFIVATNIFSQQTSDVWLMKFDSHNLSPLWVSPVIIGGDGDDTAAAVTELPDGKIVLLATMSVGSANGGVSANQSKIALLKLNGAGKLAD